VSRMSNAILACFLISFGGLSIAIQSHIFTKEFVSLPFYFLYKFVHALFACALLSIMYMYVLPYFL
jgi:hypothetical protein